MKKLLKVTTMTGLLTLFRMLFGFVFIKIVALHSGPAGLAMLGQFQSFIAIMNGLVNAPAGNGVVRFTAENHIKGFVACSPWWKASFRWVILLSVTIVPSVLILAKPLSNWLFGQEQYYWVVMASAIILPFSALGTLVTSVINGQQQYKRYVTFGAIATLFSSSIMIILVLQGDLTGAFLAAALQGGLIGSVMLCLALRQPWLKLVFWWGRTGANESKSILGYMLMALTSALTMPVALLFVRNILIENVGWSETGQWEAVWKISQVYLGVITMALSTYYLPRLSTLVGISEIKQEITNTAKIILPFVTLLALMIYLLRDVAIDILFTADFRAARDLFLFRLLGDVVKIAAWLYAFPMLSRGATKWFVLTEVSFSLSFVGLAFVFVNYYGTQGANIAYLINYTLYFGFIYTKLEQFCR